MANLSVTGAWNETMAFMKRESGLVLPIAFLLVALPAAYVDFLQLFRNQGITAALVQRERLVPLRRYTPRDSRAPIRPFRTAQLTSPFATQAVGLRPSSATVLGGLDRE